MKIQLNLHSNTYKLLFILLVFYPFIVFSNDEKRLALVIGNANYTKGELKNPVNDARLIASTLDSLDFDVIFKENLENRTDFIRSIREFGNKRSEYDVAFVYYAGHGIQVDDENFLLPTKEEFSSEEDVIDFGVSVQNVMRYLTSQTNEVNILILDACRDNPFESNWNATRSLKGSGLAKIPPPTGSLIAFSTDSGQTAPDGDGENSTYTVSLAKNMLLEDTSIDQVFRNVRAEVLAKTGGKQRPVEATQLTGQTFYLKTLSKSLLVKKINQFLINNNIQQSINLSNELIFRYPDDPFGYIKLAQAFQLEQDFENALINYKKAIKIDPSIDEIYICNRSDKLNSADRLGLSMLYYDVNPESWEDIFLNYLNLNNSNPIANFILGQLYYFANTEKSRFYFQKALEFSEFKLLPSISLYDPNDYNRNKNYLKELSMNWLIYTLNQLGEYSLGIKYADSLEKITSSNYIKSTAISAKAEIYLSKKDTINAIKFFEETINIEKEPTTLSFLSDLYEQKYIKSKSKNDLEKSFEYINQSIEFQKKSSRSVAISYANRANLNINYSGNIVFALADLNKAIEIYYDLFNQPSAYAFMERLKIYNDNKMYDYMCNDFIELKKLLSLNVFDNQSLEYIKYFLSNYFEINYDLFLNDFELEECIPYFKTE